MKGRWLSCLLAVAVATPVGGSHFALDEVRELLDELAVRQLRLRKELSKLLEPLVLKRVHKASSMPSRLRTAATTA